MKFIIPRLSLFPLPRVLPICLGFGLVTGVVAGGALDVPPLHVEITAPVGGLPVVAGEDMHIEAVAGGGSGISQVEFYVNGRLLEIDTTPPYQATLTGPRFGALVVTAVALEATGLVAVSAPVISQVVLDPSRVTFIQNGACWRYWDRDIPPVGDWRKPGYLDGSWPTGMAELGYGDGDEATVLSFGPSSDSKPVTTYFRHTFNILRPGDYTNLVLRLKRDDGAVVYLNGVEIFRDNLPAGAVSLTTLANEAADDGTVFITANISPSMLLAEENVVAVEIHQSATNSPDISFDFQLLGDVGWSIPSLTIEEAGPSGLALSWPAWAPTNFILQSRSAFDAPDGWATSGLVPDLAGERQIITLPGSGVSRYFRLCASGTGPEICQQPLVIEQTPHMAAVPGSSVELSVAATGTGSLTYQWRRNEVFLPEATSPVLLLTNVTVADGGAYDVLIGNHCGCTLSCPMLVTVGGVGVPLSDSFGDRIQTNGFSGTVVGSNAFATLQPGEPHNPAREFGRTVWLEWTAPASGMASVSTEGSGQDTSLAVYEGATLNTLLLEAAAGPSGRLRTSSVVFNAIAGTTYQVAVDGNAFSPLVALSWHLSPVPGCVPQIVVPPVMRVGTEGGSATLDVVANACPGELLAYQWYQDGVIVPGATNASLTVTNLQLASAAQYFVEVMNSGMAARSESVPIIVVNAGSISIPRSEFIKGGFCGGKFTNKLVFCYKAPNTTIEGCVVGDVQYMFPDPTQNQPTALSSSLRISTKDVANYGLDTALSLSVQDNGFVCSSLSCNDTATPNPCSKLSDRTILFKTCTGSSAYVLVTVFLKTTGNYSGCTVTPNQPVILNHSYQ